MAILLFFSSFYQPKFQYYPQSDIITKLSRVVLQQDSLVIK